MSTPTLVLLGEPQPRFPIVELPPSTSRITGVAVRRLGLGLSPLHGRDHERVWEGIPLASLIIDADGGQWKVARHDYSSRQVGGGTPTYSHEVEFEEIERIAVDLIEFEGVSLTPTRVEFQEGDGGFTAITFRAELDAEQHGKLEGVIARKRSAEDGSWYFPATFVGLGDGPVSVRFGQALWQRLGEGRARHEITLVAERTDSSRGAGLAALFEPAQPRLIEHAVEAKLTINALLAELVSAGCLNEAAEGRIRSVASSPPFAAFREFDRVLDFDAT